MRAVLIALLVSLAACDTVETFPPENGISLEGATLTVDRGVYDNDDTVTLTLRNEGERRLEMSVLECARLEQRTANGWGTAPGQDERFCIGVLAVVEAGDDLQGTVDLDLVGGAPDGTYRFVHRTNVGDLATASFDVR